MEKVPSNRGRSLIVIFLVLAGFIWVLLRQSPISVIRKTTSSADDFDMKLTVVSPTGEQVLPADSRFVPKSTTPAAAVTSTPPAAPKATPVEGQVDLTLVHRAPAFTLSIADGAKFLSWVDNDPKAHELIDSPAVKGIFHDVLKTLKVRTEELQLEGVAAMTVESLFREALKAGAQFHFDPYEGQKGFSFSFERARTPVLAGVLPVLVQALSRRAYKAPGTESPVEELTVGSQTLYMTEDGGRVFLSNGLKALLNLIDLKNADTSPVSSGDSVLLTIRSEQFVRNLLPLITGRNAWDARFGFALSDKTGPGLTLKLDPAVILSYLHPSISPGIFAALPQDVFAAAAMSFAVSPQLTPEQWNEIATKGVTPAAAPPEGDGGVAFLWDLSPEAETPSSIGVAVSVSKDANPAVDLASYFDSDAAFIGECGGGTVKLASTNELMLTRMKESCDRQSRSFLNWFEEGKFAAVDAKPQLLFALNPNVGLSSALDIGVRARAAEDDANGTIQPEWKTQYDQAIAQTTRTAFQTFSRMPAIIYLGKGSAAGAELQGVLQ